MASLIIACGWMVWHVPAFFYLRSYTHLGLGSAIGFFLGILFGAFLFTWISNGAGGSAFLPIVFHGLLNFTTAPPSSGGLIAAVISTVIKVLGLVAVWRPELRSGFMPRPVAGDEARPATRPGSAAREGDDR